MKTLALVLFAMFTTAAQSAQFYEVDEENSRLICERLLNAHKRDWRKEAEANLTAISAFPVYPVTISDRAENLIAQALNIKPEFVPELKRHAFKIAREGDRLQMELENWPQFHRTLISLRRPEIISDPSLLHAAHDFYASVQANTRLFYPIRILPHETELGLAMPVQNLARGEAGQPPYFEFQIALLKPCFDTAAENETHEQIFFGEDGASVCLDPLLTLSTWAEVFEPVPLSNH